MEDTKTRRNFLMKASLTAGGITLLTGNAANAQTLPEDIIVVESYDDIKQLSPVPETGRVFKVTDEGIAGDFVVKSGTKPGNNATVIEFNHDSYKYAERIENTPVNARWFGAKGDGLTNDTAALQNWLDYLDSANFENPSIEGQGQGFLPDGIYLTNSTLTTKTGTTIMGVARRSVIQPTLTDSTAIIVNAGCFIDGISINGKATVGKCIGIDLGSTTRANNITIQNCNVVEFNGTGSVGIKFSEAIYIDIYRCVFSNNNHGMEFNHANNPTTPDLITIKETLVNTNSNYGVYAVGGSSVRFSSCAFEKNGSEGVYMNTTAGTGTDLSMYQFSHCWFESNHTDTSKGPARNSRYQVLARGRAISFRDNYFFGNSVEAKGVYYNSAIDFLDDHNQYDNQTAIVKVDGTSNGTFSHWQQENGAWKTSVMDTSTGYANYSDTLHGSYDPGLTFSNPGDLSIAYEANKAYWSRTGNMVTIHYFIQTSAFAHNSASGNLRIDLGPFTAANKMDGVYVGTVIWQGITKSGCTQINSRVLANTSNIEFYASTSGLPISAVTAADMPSFATVSLQGTITFEMTNA